MILSVTADKHVNVLVLRTLAILCCGFTVPKIGRIGAYAFWAAKLSITHNDLALFGSEKNTKVRDGACHIYEVDRAKNPAGQPQKCTFGIVGFVALIHFLLLI